uniref:type IV pilus twitching motility protein PilT n=1 Tax=Eubacterium cellulosolvens TaxID=29322 RepID=UPI000481F669|nr:PilT/PilU family type 4a pilus ATPase [[Eubacterium] cellulosolvens]
MDITDILREAISNHASDLFIVANLPLSHRVNGNVVIKDGTRLVPADTEELIRQIYHLAKDRDLTRLMVKGDDDFSFAIPGLSRFRVNAFKQRGSLSAVIRVISFVMPDPASICIPESIINMSRESNGMILITGPAGNGKSTTLACIIDAINHQRSSHIITLEDPIEYLHRHNKSIISQREINIDTESYVTALRAALRQSPDVILLGEMRDYETIAVAMTAAETGHLLFSTLHTVGAANTINRIIDVFPANQQRQIAVQLSTVLKAVISQQLVPSVSGTRIPAFEIMMVNPAVRNMIRENKVYQIDGLIANASSDTMQSMDTSLLQLYRKGLITRETAITYATNQDMLARRLSM